MWGLTVDRKLSCEVRRNVMDTRSVPFILSPNSFTLLMFGATRRSGITTFTQLLVIKSLKV